MDRVPALPEMPHEHCGGGGGSPQLLASHTWQVRDFPVLCGKTPQRARRWPLLHSSCPLPPQSSGPGHGAQDVCTWLREHCPYLWDSEQGGGGVCVCVHTGCALKQKSLDAYGRESEQEYLCVGHSALALGFLREKPPTGVYTAVLRGRCFDSHEAHDDTVGESPFPQGSVRTRTWSQRMTGCRLGPSAWSSLRGLGGCRSPDHVKSALFTGPARLSWSTLGAVTEGR